MRNHEKLLREIEILNKFLTEAASKKEKWKSRATNFKERFCLATSIPIMY